MKLFDLTGQQLLNEDIREGSNTIQAAVPSGIYLVAIESEATTITQKLTVIR
jgi:hypothetical protein